MYNSIMKVHLKKASTVLRLQKRRKSKLSICDPKKTCQSSPTRWNDQIISGVYSSPYENGMKNGD